MELSSVLILFGVGCIAGLLNVMAGGGSTLTVPALIFMGLDGAMANGTNRVAIMVQNIFAVQSFRQQNVGSIRIGLGLAAWTLPGAIIGAFAAAQVSDEWFQRILGIVLIGVIISMILPGQKAREVSQGPPSKWIYAAMLGIGFYGGFIQVGVGFILMAALYHLFKVNLVWVNMYKIFIVLIYTVPALGIFVYTGNVDWGLGLSLAAGNAFGGWWAARFAVKKGEKLVRIMLFVAVGIISVKLLGGF